jgi:hypothetical protein
MKFYRRILLRKDVCPPDFYAEILRLYPAGAPGGLLWLMEAKAGDEETAELVERIAALCKARGLDNIPGAYSHSVLPHWEASDFHSAPLLWLMTQERMFKGIDSDKRDERGRVVLPAPKARATVRIASIWPKPWLVVSAETRRVLEGGGLVGLEFVGVAIKGRSVHTSPEPFWELRSTVTLPKMVNSVPDTTVDWDPVRYVLRDQYGEPHYRQSELQPLGAFDIGRTFELLSGGDPHFIISQRFYQHCLKNRIPLEVRPARIDLE